MMIDDDGVMKEIMNLCPLPRQSLQELQEMQELSRENTHLVTHSSGSVSLLFTPW